MGSLSVCMHAYTLHYYICIYSVLSRNRVMSFIYFWAHGWLLCALTFDGLAAIVYTRVFYTIYYILFEYCCYIYMTCLCARSAYKPLYNIYMKHRSNALSVAHCYILQFFARDWIDFKCTFFHVNDAELFPNFLDNIYCVIHYIQFIPLKIILRI